MKYELHKQIEIIRHKLDTIDNEIDTSTSEAWAISTLVDLETVSEKLDTIHALKRLYEGLEK